MSKKLISRTIDATEARQTQAELYAGGSLRVDSKGDPMCLSPLTYETNFLYLPSTSVSATTDAATTESGTGTEVIARSSKGGANLKSQASTPADNDNVLLVGAANTGMVAGLINAKTGLRFSARIALNKITALFLSIGLNENLTDADPTGTSGDGAMFVFDPTGEFVKIANGFATDGSANWILAHKVAGADTFTDTGLAVVAAQDYSLHSLLNADRTTSFFINGDPVGTGPALTDGSTMGVMLGFELTATPAEQKDVDVRFLRLSRQIG